MDFLLGILDWLISRAPETWIALSIGLVAGRLSALPFFGPALGGIVAVIGMQWLSRKKPEPTEETSRAPIRERIAGGIVKRLIERISRKD